MSNREEIKEGIEPIDLSFGDLRQLVGMHKHTPDNARIFARHFKNGKDLMGTDRPIHTLIIVE